MLQNGSSKSDGLPTKRLLYTDDREYFLISFSFFHTGQTSIDRHKTGLQTCTEQKNNNNKSILNVLKDTDDAVWWSEGTLNCMVGC